MFIRQFRLLWQAKSVMEGGGRTAELVKQLNVQSFAAKRLEQQSKRWRTDELERAFELLYHTDGLLKTGSDGHLVLENLVLSLCR
jgi:DNA polymerase III delta subunit